MANHHLAPNDIANFSLIPHGNAPDRTPLGVQVQVQGAFLEIYVDGYGLCEGDDGGAVIALEHYDGRLRVISYPHINEVEPIIIDMQDSHLSGVLPEVV